jgi:hypothetical protein
VKGDPENRDVLLVVRLLGRDDGAYEFVHEVDACSRHPVVWNSVISNERAEAQHARFS